MGNTPRWLYKRPTFVQNIRSSCGVDMSSLSPTLFWAPGSWIPVRTESLSVCVTNISPFPRSTVQHWINPPPPTFPQTHSSSSPRWFHASPRQHPQTPANNLHLILILPFLIPHSLYPTRQQILMFWNTSWHIHISLSRATTLYQASLIFHLNRVIVTSLFSSCYPRIQVL